MPPETSPVQRLRDLETSAVSMQQSIEALNNDLRLFAVYVTNTITPLIEALNLLPHIMNQQMPAIRATEVRKFQSKLNAIQLELPLEFASVEEISLTK